jgi:hypothetical protein
MRTLITPARFGRREPHKNRLSQLSTKESDVCREAKQQPLEEDSRPTFFSRNGTDRAKPKWYSLPLPQVINGP